MKVLVTGAAGFIGSHAVEQLLIKGYDVVGLDAFLGGVYPSSTKISNFRHLESLANGSLEWLPIDLRTASLEAALDGVDSVIHFAAMPGLMLSWADVDLYASCNVVATARLSEAAANSSVKRLIHVSTSSVYGTYAREKSQLEPRSPYGATKLAAEHVVKAYADNFGLGVSIVRLYSVYGPRQRPDMAFHSLMHCLQRGAPFTMYGDGSQRRTNTYVLDAAQAVIGALERGQTGATYEVSGKESASLSDVIATCESFTGRRLNVIRESNRPGDQVETSANLSLAEAHLNWRPTVLLETGLPAQWNWLQQTACCE